MAKLSYKWEADGSEHVMELVQVFGTEGKPFLFGRGSNRCPVEVPAFYIATTPVTQALWLHVMGSNLQCVRIFDAQWRTFRGNTSLSAGLSRSTQCTRDINDSGARQA